MNLLQAYIKADSMAAVDGGAELELGVTGKLLGKSRTWTLSVSFPPTPEGILESLWDAVKSDLS